ncbi:hypothetical protein AOLI_G00181000 [Acnodon oligacanthus]
MEVGEFWKQLVNASLQCLFRAESFCTQVSRQLSDLIYDSSAQLIRCFTELWWMRESTDWEMKASLLMEFIEAAAATNPDFTVDTQNDAHEFLSHLSLPVAAQGSVNDCLRLFFSDEAEVECRCEVCECNSASCSLVNHHNRAHIDSELQLILPMQRVPEDHTHKEAKPPDHQGLHTPPDDTRQKSR